MLMRRDDELKVHVDQEMLDGSEVSESTPETPVAAPGASETSQGDIPANEPQGPENGVQDVAEGAEPVEGEPEPGDEADPEADEAVDGDPETFPKAYVEQLRKEAADNRVKAKRTDDLAGRLHAQLVASTGKLADPTDLPFDEAHLDDPGALDAAIESLIEAKPHLASRTPRGNIGQGGVGKSDDGFSLAGWLGGVTR